jgi:hypothetical protein
MTDWTPMRAMRAKVDMLREYVPSSRRDFLQAGDECPTCQGSGYVYYSDTSTWRGGIGGQVFTHDVCNHCWGSGSDSKPWPRHPR